MEAVRALDLAIRQERLIRGEPSDRTAISVEEVTRGYNLACEAIKHETADPKEEWSAKQKWRETREAILEDAEGAFLPMIETQLSNLRESHTLAALRDALLPRLLSGELRVREAEQLVEEAV